MEKEVFVSVIGVQNDMLSEDKDDIEFITKGKYYEKGQKKYITYKEASMNGEKDTLSTVKIERDRVTLSRMGSNSTNMIFEVGKKHISYYATPFGSFELGITTRHIDTDFKDDSGEVKISYLLEVNNNPVGINEICIKVQNNKGKFKL